MQPIEVHVLGPLSVIVAPGAELHLSAAIRQFVALVVASGRSGLSKEQLSNELWPTERPASWKSAIRNRVTAARRRLGHETILNVSNRYRLADSVYVDAWDLLEHQGDGDAGHVAVMFETLRREPFAGIDASPLIEAARREIHFARSASIRTIGRRPEGLLPKSLEALRLYQQEHPLDAAVTEETVRAHLKAGDALTAHSIIEATRDIAIRDGASTRWIDALTRLRHQQVAELVSEAVMKVDDPVAAKRSELFAASLEREEWTIAFEVASGQLAYSAPVEGDIDRVELLKQVPADKLDPARRFQLAGLLARDGRIFDPELAKEQSRLVQHLASTSNESFLAEATAALVGDVEDELKLMSLPQALTDSSVPSDDLSSYQVGVANYLERASASQAQPVLHRFCELVEQADEPLRRWHVLVLEAMQAFSRGSWAVAAERAKHACDYGSLFGIAESDFIWRCQVFNSQWVRRSLGLNAATQSYLFAKPTSIFGSAYDAAERASSHDVERFLDEFDLDGRMTFSVPLLVMLAPFVVDADLTQQLLARLAGRSGTSAIFGAGCAHFGPVDRMCAHLSDESAEKHRYLSIAISVADDQQTRLWQVACRLELAALSRDDALRDEATELADTPALCSLVESFGARA